MSGRSARLVAGLMALVLIGAGVAAATVDSAARPGRVADSSYGVGLKLTSKVVAHGTVLNIVQPWLRWNSKTCSYEVAKTHPATYVANTRQIVGNWQIGYMHYGNSDPFGIANSKSVADTASRAGFKLNVYNLEYPSKTVPLDQAKLSVLRKDRGVMQGNLEPTVLPAFFKILQTDGCVPTIAVYGGPGDKTPAIGAIFEDTGRLQGEWMAKEAKARGWLPTDTAFLQCTDPSIAPFVQKIFPASLKALLKGGFNLPPKNLYKVNCQGQSPTNARQVVTDWFTGHPNFKHVLINAPDDLRVTGIIQALKASGRLDSSTIRIGAGLDPIGRAQVRAGTEDASVAFFPEHYGLFLLPVLEDVMAGKPVPQFVQHVQVVVTKKTIGKYYPNGK